MRSGVPPTRVAALAQLACVLETTAAKPGNVSPGRPFRDTSVEDFLLAAAAVAPVLAEAGNRPLGLVIRSAVEATARVARRNPNLGIVLLLAPLAQAAQREGGPALRERVGQILAGTTVADAVEAYQAIRMAAPGGLGRSPKEDVAEVPHVALREAMVLAAPRDSVAREYATDYSLTFEVTVPALARARADGLGWLDATVECALLLLAREPDSLIARKLGAGAAAQVTEEAGRVAGLGGVRTAAGRVALEAFDASLRNAQNSRNPGTTADLIAAALFVLLLDAGP